jgi:hypothetical protein
VMPNLLPYLGVYWANENQVPNGDANCTDIRFNHTLQLGFSIIVINNDEDAAEQQIDAGYWVVMNRLWRDPGLMNVYISSLPDSVEIESLMRGVVKRNYGFAGANNETPIAELQYDVSIFYRSEWFPDITDTLNEIYVTTGIKSTDTQADMQQRWQEQVYYNFD